MRNCPHCGGEIDTTATSSNAKRTITLEIPEEHFALMRVTFIEMANKLGMYGYGDLANDLSPYSKQFDHDFEHMRFFDEKLVAFAFKAVKLGYKAKVVIGKDGRPSGILPDPRVKVHVELALGEDNRKLAVADNAIRSAAEWFKEYFEDAATRIAPMD